MMRYFDGFTDKNRAVKLLCCVVSSSLLLTMSEAVSPHLIKQVAELM